MSSLIDLSALQGITMLISSPKRTGDGASGRLSGHVARFKFDDETVTPCSEYAAIEDNYGGDDLAVWNYFDRRPSELHRAQSEGERFCLSSGSYPYVFI